MAIQQDGGRNHIDAVLFRLPLVLLNVVNLQMKLGRKAGHLLQELARLSAIEALLPPWYHEGRFPLREVDDPDVALELLFELAPDDLLVLKGDQWHVSFS